MQDKHTAWAGAAESTTATNSSSNTAMGPVPGKLLSSRNLECRAWPCSDCAITTRGVIDCGCWCKDRSLCRIRK